MKLSLGLCILLAGCAVGPNYREPKTAVPADWHTSARGGATNQPLAVTQWWKTFHDPQLDSLIERAVAANLDLRIATGRLREARALRGFATADLGPSLKGVGAYTDSRQSENAQLFPVPDLHTHTYEAGFDASWEIDLFGGKRRSSEAARAVEFAAEANRRDVLVSLLAEVARNYVEVRGLQRRIAIARENIATQQSALDLTQKRYQAGVSSLLDVSQAASLLAGTKSDLPTLQTSLQNAMHRLAVLQGQPPGALLAELEAVAPVPAPPPTVPIGLPADLLRRRPDIRRAERELAAANAWLGAQVAELFPKFSLVGMAGLQSLSASDFFSNGSQRWTIGPTVTWRLFEFGRIQAQIRAANAREEQALAAYEQTVLKAVEEVENALVAYAQEQDRQRILSEQVAADRRAVDLAHQLYTKGATSFLNLIITRRSLYVSEDKLVDSERAVTGNLIALYKALGGGWEDGPVRE
jgi:NodT family efflux transporter outer membrane factor (OMF) lipoprotein